MTLPVKRSREEKLAQADNYLMLLSKVGQSEAAAAYSASRPPAAAAAGRSFTCKTCNREFPSFQALGGHRASHKKPNKLTGVDGLLLKAAPSLPPKPKSHECPICGLEFPIGQALGGHMRRHRAPQENNNGVIKNTTKITNNNAEKLDSTTHSNCSTTTTTTSSTVSEAGHEPAAVQRVVKKPRVMVFGVDLSSVAADKDVKLELGQAGRDSPAPLVLDLLV